MPSSMFSQNKQDDQELLLELGEVIECLARVGTKEMWDFIEQFGAHYLKLEEKIKSHDYSPEDAINDRINARLKHEVYTSVRNN